MQNNNFGFFQNLLISKLNPQQRAEFNNLYNNAMQSGNPENYILQKFSNNTAIQNVLKARQEKTPAEFEQYINNYMQSIMMQMF